MRAAAGSAARELYQQVILDHNRTPRNWGALQPHSHHAEGHNPLCGDRYEVAVALAADGSIGDIRFQGSGCAISKASASMMTEAVKGLPRAAVERLVEQFRRLVAGELDPARDSTISASCGCSAVSGSFRRASSAPPCRGTPCMAPSTVPATPAPRRRPGTRSKQAWR